MEHVVSIVKVVLNSPWLYMVTFGSILFLILTGRFKYKGHGLNIGGADDERTILRRQTNYIDHEMDAIASTMLKEHPDFDRWRTKYIVEKVYDEYIRAIHWNHISNSTSYVDDIYGTLLAIVQKRSEKDYFWTDEFKSFLKEHTTKVVAKLVNIRKEYK